MINGNIRARSQAPARVMNQMWTRVWSSKDQWLPIKRLRGAFSGVRKEN
jgi:hypothetical protein